MGKDLRFTINEDNEQMFFSNDKLEECQTLLRWIMMNLLRHQEMQWWLFLYVILTRPQHTQIGGETLFIDLSVRVSAEEISVRINELQKVNSIM